tara:strand:- start:147 stop:350 length:204 start_codon:yes stop_codon:yes gene_type:complete
MELIKRIKELKKSVEDTDQLIEELISSLNAQQLRADNKEKKILELKEEVRSNVEKIDLIIKDHNANT